MKRYKHSLSHYQLSTFDMGQLIPVSNFEVLPGDSVRMASSCLLRASPLMAPVMHPVNIRLHHWFVPYRLLWDDWEDFITGGPDGEGAATSFPAYPSQTYAANSLADYFGIPVGVTVPSVSALPFRAYHMIYNEFYRDQDLENPVNLDTADVHNVAWEKDYFTAARPWTQKGPDVTVPIGATAPVKTMATTGTDLSVLNSADAATKLTASAAFLQLSATAGDSANELFADLSEATGTDVNELRMAFALQRYQEARAQYGSRYTEYLRYLGVRSSDARLQRPEYLGGGRATFSFSEVLRTGNEGVDSDAPVGEMKGHGIAALRSRRFIKFFEEHGIVITLASVRPRAVYADGLDRMWSRRIKEDFWQKELELVGQQEVPNKEVYAAHASPDETFGFQDRYAEYRHEPSRVTSLFRTTMSDWHLARLFGSAPALNHDFIECVPSKRIFAEQTQPAIWAMFSHSVQCRRMVGHRTIGRIM